MAAPPCSSMESVRASSSRQYQKLKHNSDISFTVLKAACLNAAAAAASPRSSMESMRASSFEQYQELKYYCLACRAENCVDLPQWHWGQVQCRNHPLHTSSGNKQWVVFAGCATQEDMHGPVAVILKEICCRPLLKVALDKLRLTMSLHMLAWHFLLGTAVHRSPQL